MKNTDETKANTNRLRAYWKATTDPATIPKTTKRVCKICGEYKDCGWNYTFSQTGKPEYRTKCVECFKEYSRKIQKKNRPTRLKNHKLSNRQRKQEAVNYLGGKCAICGYNKSLAALTFHHKNPCEKDRTIGKMLDWSWTKLLEELNKCDLLCFNCHMELHEKENGVYI